MRGCLEKHTADANGELRALMRNETAGSERPRERTGSNAKDPMIEKKKANRGHPHVEEHKGKTRARVK